MGNTHTQEASVMRVSQANARKHTAEPQLRAAAHGDSDSRSCTLSPRAFRAESNRETTAHLGPGN